VFFTFFKNWKQTFNRYYNLIIFFFSNKEWTAAEIEALMTKEICEEDFPDLNLYVIEDEDLASFKLEKQKEEAARIKRERDGYLSPTSK